MNIPIEAIKEAREALSRKTEVAIKRDPTSAETWQLEDDLVLLDMWIKSIEDA